MTPKARAVALTLGVFVAACCGVTAEGVAPTPYKPVEASMAPVVVSAATPAPTARQRGSIAAVEAPTPKPEPRGATKTGKATWYCCTKGYGEGEMVAAAGSELRKGNWRGKKVEVCADRCITVTLVDWCGCPGSRVIDLHPAAFSRLAPLSRGVIPVTAEFR